MKKFTRISAMLVAVMLFAAGSTFGNLVTDPAALAAWQGTANFMDPTGLLFVNVDYAVYAPGQYPDNNVTGNDPSNGTEYVYAYQVFNVSNAAKPPYFTTMTVGMDTASAAHNGSADPLHDLLGGIAPNITIVTMGVSAQFVVSCIIPQIAPNQHTQVVLFTSPYGPAWFQASVTDSGASDSAIVPAPLPEPATLSLLALASVAMLRRRR